MAPALIRLLFVCKISSANSSSVAASDVVRPWYFVARVRTRMMVSCPGFGLGRVSVVFGSCALEVWLCGEW